MFRMFRVWRARSRFTQAFQERDWPVAAEAGEILLGESPDDHELCNNVGVAQLEAGDPTKAAASFRQANELRESSIHTNNLGRALLAAGQHAEAREAFEKASRLNPTDPQPRYNLVVCLREEGRSAEMAEELTRFAARFPKHAGGQNDLGCLEEERGHREQAVSHFQASVDLAPSYFPARLNLIRLLCDLGRFPETVPHLEGLAAAGAKVRVNATDTAVEIDLDGRPFIGERCRANSRGVPRPLVRPPPQSRLRPLIKAPRNPPFLRP
jgi:tetratricopeptide (TPR) repeat protein